MILSLSKYLILSFQATFPSEKQQKHPQEPHSHMELLRMFKQLNCQLCGKVRFQSDRHSSQVQTLYFREEIMSMAYLAVLEIKHYTGGQFTRMTYAAFNLTASICALTSCRVHRYDTCNFGLLVFPLVFTPQVDPRSPILDLYRPREYSRSDFEKPDFHI